MSDSELILAATLLIGGVTGLACLKVIVNAMERASELAELKARCAQLRDGYRQRLEAARQRYARMPTPDEVNVDILDDDGNVIEMGEPADDAAEEPALAA